MKTLKYFGFILLAAVLLFAGFIIYSQITFYNPPQELVLNENSEPDTIRCDSTFSIMSWNIGYAGLGENMDFFYDGGEMVRDTYERTVTNLDSINQFLKRNSSRTFILIQEVDLHSKRSYFLNEMDTIVSHTDFYFAFAPNYLVGFVPIPPNSPMGKVNSGVMSLSKYFPEISKRYGYPGMFGWPVRLFNLRRCMLVNRYPTSNGKEFVLINTHMSAFDDGSLKKQEMQYLKDYVLAEFAAGNYVVVGGDWKWVFDSEKPTNRYLNESYIPGKTFSSLIDLFLVSPNVEVVKSVTFGLNFRNSDHNPISMDFRLVK